MTLVKGRIFYCREDSMSVEQQEGTWHQMSLLEAKEGQVRHGASGEGGTGPAAREEWQAPTLLERERALTGDLRYAMLHQ